MKAGILVGVVVVLIIVAGSIFFSSYIKNVSTEGDLGFEPSPVMHEDREEITDSLTIDSNLTIGSEEKIDKKAAFAIFTNGTFRIFSAPMYHNLSPDVFIERPKPNIIQMRKEGVTWDDFFRTLPLKIDHECLTTGTGQTFCTGKEGTLKFYINGEDSTGDALPKIINDADKLLVSFGKETGKEIDAQLNKIPNP